MTIGMIALTLMTACVNVAHAGIAFQHISLAQGVQKAKAEGKPLFIDVYATWCGPCKYLSKEVFTDDALGAYMNENFICLKLDGEKEDGSSLMSDFDLDSYPTLLFLSADKELIKKLVGAVPADHILTKAKGVIDPEGTQVYRMQQRFKEGDRNQDFMRAYINELINEDHEVEPVIATYLELFPDLDFDNEDDFLIFCLGVDDRDHPLMKAFIGSAAQLGQTFPEYAQAKIEIMLMQSINDALEQDDPEIIQQDCEALYAAYSSIYGDNSLEKDALIEVLNEAYIASK